MPNLLIVILNNTNLCPELLIAWQDIGVPGTTIYKSAGGYASRTWLSKVGLGSINNLFDVKEIQNRTVMTVIDDEEVLAKAIAEADRIVGGFDRPHSGLLFVIPVAKSLGLTKTPPLSQQEEPSHELSSGWNRVRNTTVEAVDELMKIKPVTVEAGTSLENVARIMLENPHVHVACVVSKAGGLIGIIDVKTLADDLFFHVLPEEFLNEITDLEKLMAYADKTRILVARDAMKPSVWIKRSETVKDAFKKMHDNHLPGLPIIDDHYHVTGYINLLELLSLSIQIKNDDDDSEVQS